MKASMKIALLAGVLAVLFCAQAAMAHVLWLNPDKTVVKPGEEISVGMGFGHGYPADRKDENVREGMLGEVFAMGPDGKATPLQKISDSEYKFKADKPGAYLLSAVMKPGFFSRTPQGMKRGSKKEVAEAVSCMHFQMIANAPMVAGASAAKPGAPAKQALQIAPQAAVAGLKKGDTLPIQVIFNGKPLAAVDVKATYAGFKAPPQAKGDKSAEAMRKKMAARFPVFIKTDDQGRADIKLSQAGWWLVILSHKTPFEDAKTCDQHVYQTTFTFQVK